MCLLPSFKGHLTVSGENSKFISEVAEEENKFDACSFPADVVRLFSFQLKSIWFMKNQE